jgi:hypothetical protein
MAFKFHCDVSYDGNPPKNAKGISHVPITYAFAGFFATDQIWEFIKQGWQEVNKRYAIPRFHAAHLNGKTHEYRGWSDSRKVDYSSELLNILHEPGKDLSAVSCGILADEYRRIINEDGRRKLGSPYLVCFNSCITRVARAMDRVSLPANERFSVLLDEDPGHREAIGSFNNMRDNPRFEHGGRLGACMSGSMAINTALQPADLIAYEVFKWLQGIRKRPGEKFPPEREPLKRLLAKNEVSERYFGRETLTRMKSAIEATPSPDGGLVIVPES